MDEPGGDDAWDEVAAALGAVVRSHQVDGSGWRWRVGWQGVELGAWNDMDGVAVVADIGPWDDWLGLANCPPDPSPTEALEWAVAVLAPWLDVPANRERIDRRAIERADRGEPS